jgi:Ras-related protein Rab-21
MTEPSQGYYSAKQQSTIGAFFLTKKIVLSDDSICKMQLWDTAGQERFRAMAPVGVVRSISLLP